MSTITAVLEADAGGTRPSDLQHRKAQISAVLELASEDDPDQQEIRAGRPLPRIS